MVTSERFWEAYARWYDTIWDGPVIDAIREDVQGRLGAPNLVVDLGCGTGLLSAGLPDNGIRVVGVDTSRGMLDRALSARRISRAVHAPAEATELDSGTADAVIIANLLHLHPDPAVVIAEARRIAAPGAPIVVTWPVPRLTAPAMFLVDRAAGRSLIASLTADYLRRWAGRLASRARGAVAARARGADTDQLSELLDSNAVVVAGCAIVGTIPTE